MERQLIARLDSALQALPIFDPHSHVEPLAPVAKTLDDLLGYHYYTELAHAIGADRKRLTPETDPRERSRYLFKYLPRLENTVQYSWLLEICQTFFGWTGDRLTPGDFETVWNLAEQKLNQPDWEQHVWQQTNLKQIYLTNEFDDPLQGFDTAKYVPCLRMDSLVNNIHQWSFREKVQRVTGVEIGKAKDLESALNVLFQRFIKQGSKACALSLPSQFPYLGYSSEMQFDAEMRFKRDSSNTWPMQGFVFHAVMRMCEQYQLPFDLMIGVKRQVYQHGVYQGQDLMDQPGTLLHYADLFNAHPKLKFCVSVLTSQQNQELASYSWIFPNVYTSGHWWYSNVPTLIDRDLRLRMQAVPAEKQIAYYSDAYKLEFVLPKFAMYRRVLAKVLAEEYVLDRSWSEERALQLGEKLLIGNTIDLFGK
jgi:glucuronate isomerase